MANTEALGHDVEVHIEDQDRAEAEIDGAAVTGSEEDKFDDDGRWVGCREAKLKNGRPTEVGELALAVMTRLGWR